MSDKLSIRIDGEYVAAQDGQTILEVARASGKYIPTLCWLEGITSVGACRLCIVEVSGAGRLLPACTTPVQHGMLNRVSAVVRAYDPCLSCSTHADGTLDLELRIIKA